MEADEDICDRLDKISLNLQTVVAAIDRLTAAVKAIP